MWIQRSSRLPPLGRPDILCWLHPIIGFGSSSLCGPWSLWTFCMTVGSNPTTPLASAFRKAWMAFLVNNDCRMRIQRSWGGSSMLDKADKPSFVAYESLVKSIHSCLLILIAKLELNDSCYIRWSRSTSNNEGKKWVKLTPKLWRKIKYKKPRIWTLILWKGKDVCNFLMKALSKILPYY